MDDRAERLIAAARRQLGVRYRHQGRLSGVGLDCLGLLQAAAREAGMQTIDRLDYGHFPDEGVLREGLGTVLRAVEGPPVPGDVLLLKVDGSARHLALVTDHPDGLGMIHAYAPLRKVVEHRLDAVWLGASAGLFRLRD